MIQVLAKFIGFDPILKDQVATIRKEGHNSPFVQAKFESVDLPERFTKKWNLFAATQFQEMKSE